MKVIIPMAGKGTRLRPHTHVTPKPMLRVAGKPVMQYILDDLRKLGGIDEVIYITGHLKEKVEEYARNAVPRDNRCSSSRRSRTARRAPSRWRGHTWTSRS